MVGIIDVSLLVQIATNNRSESMMTESIHSQGGAVNLGNISTHTFIGRDQIIVINISAAQEVCQEITDIINKTPYLPTSIKISPLTTLLTEFCSNFDFPYKQDNNNRIVIGLFTATDVLHIVFCVNEQDFSFEYSAILAELDVEAQKYFAEQAVRNPVRGITPILIGDKAGITGSFSRLPSNKQEIQSAFIDAIARVASYFDHDFPQLRGQQ